MKASTTQILEMQQLLMKVVILSQMKASTTILKFTGTHSYVVILSQMKASTTQRTLNMATSIGLSYFLK